MDPDNDIPDAPDNDITDNDATYEDMTDKNGTDAGKPAADGELGMNRLSTEDIAATEKVRKERLAALNAQGNTLREDQERAEQRDALRLEASELFELCRRMADAAEHRQEQLAQDLTHWEMKGGWGAGPVGRIRMSRPPTPLPLRDGLRTPLARMIRRLDTAEGYLLLTVRAAEKLVLPRLSASGPEEHDAVNGLIGDVLGLDDALESGMLTAHLVLWEQTPRWPRRPVSLRLTWPGGKAQEERLLGEYGPALDHLIAAILAERQRHILGGRVLLNPPAPGPPKRW